jgi:hypothetical protein
MYKRIAKEKECGKLGDLYMLRPKRNKTSKGHHMRVTGNTVTRVLQIIPGWNRQMRQLVLQLRCETDT